MWDLVSCFFRRAECFILIGKSRSGSFPKKIQNPEGGLALYLAKPYICMPLAGTVNPAKSRFPGLSGSPIFSAKEKASQGTGRSVEAERSIPKTKCALDVEGPGLEVLCLISSWRPQSLPKPPTSKSQDAGSAHSSMNL